MSREILLLESGKNQEHEETGLRKKLALSDRTLQLVTSLLAPIDYGFQDVLT